MKMIKEPRVVVTKFLAAPQHEGLGAVVRRSIGRFDLKYFDPFLLLDEFSVTAPAGFPDHPHRGFETVTYMLEGRMRHEDFKGHEGTIGAGDLQWMTAGKGIVHSEMPSSHGTQHGLQLWINLSSKYKMIEPRYQEIRREDIVEAAKDGVKVKVIAGEALGTKSPIYTTPTMYLDFTLRPGSRLEQPIPALWNAFVYVLEGEGVFGSSKSAPITPHHLVLLGCGDGVQAWNKSSCKALRFILVGGQPLNESVVQLGPFVMNTQEEIDQTIEDFENCKNGFERARHWRSQAAAAASSLGLHF